MRGHIFTDRERRIVKDFLDEKIKITHRGLSQIRTRLKGFEPSLLEDIKLLQRLRAGIAEAEAARSA